MTQRTTEGDAALIQMTNRFYVKGEERADGVAELFRTVAARYDLLNDIQSLGLHRLWKRRLVKLATLRPGDPALDVCCGTGDITFRLARCGANAVGLDFSEPMLDVARRRRGAASAPEFVQGNALRLPFADDQFMAVTVGYGLRNLEDWRAGLGEMVRVTRRTGRILVLDFGKPDNPLLRRSYFLYLRWMVPVFGWMFCGNAAAYAYILQSLHDYPAQAGVAAEMRECGLIGVTVHNLLGGMMSINVGIKD